MKTRDDGLHEVEHEVWETESPEFVNGRVEWARPTKAQDPRTWLQDTLDFYREARAALLAEALDYDEEDKAPREGVQFKNNVALGRVAVEAGSILAQNLDALERLWRALLDFQTRPDKDYAAFMVGRAEAELRAMLQSRHLWRGRKSYKGAQDGQATTYGTQTEKQARWEGHRTAYAAIKARNPHLLHEDLCRLTARERGVSVPTIKRHCQRK